MATHLLTMPSLDPYSRMPEQKSCGREGYDSGPPGTLWRRGPDSATAMGEYRGPETGGEAPEVAKGLRD